MYVRHMDTPERLTHQIDQYDAWQRDTIRRHGWALQAVLGDEEGRRSSTRSGCPASATRS